MGSLEGNGSRRGRRRVRPGNWHYCRLSAGQESPLRDSVPWALAPSPDTEQNWMVRAGRAAGTLLNFVSSGSW